MGDHICHPSSHLVETEGPVQLHSHLEARLDYVKPCLKIEGEKSRKERRGGKGRRREGRGGEKTERED